ncbi:hypothetical protein U9M48_031918 [Paspalum notatum var. saurae]|uniref:Uncharacterized protein n=1 Tax=Paspalum notatum var. saurae TaxID=547442 RepID=A0AAQ3U6S4_PASNO
MAGKQLGGGCGVDSVRGGPMRQLRGPFFMMKLPPMKPLAPEATASECLTRQRGERWDDGAACLRSTAGGVRQENGSSTLRFLAAATWSPPPDDAMAGTTRQVLLRRQCESRGREGRGFSAGLLPSPKVGWRDGCGPQLERTHLPTAVRHPPGLRNI